MTRKTRQLLLALTVTTALCADRVAVAAPSLRPQVAELAGRIVTRLTRSFSESVPVEFPVHARQRVQPSRPQPAAVVPADDVARQPLAPFQFRLPPPAC